MTDDRVRTMWTDEQLDDALGALHDTRPDNDLSAARAAFAEAVGAEPSRTAARRGRWYVAAAAAAVLAVGVATVPFGQSDDGGRARGAERNTKTRLTTAAQVLDSAAASALRAGDPKPGPNRFTKVVSREWFATGGGMLPVPADSPPTDEKLPSYLTEDRYEQWVPTTKDGTWYYRYHRSVNNRFFRPGDRQKLIDAGYELGRPSEERYTGHNGQMDSDSPPVATTWGTPTPEFFAAQPREVNALLAKLVHDPNKPVLMNGDRGDTRFLHLAQALGSGIVPADLRAAMFKAAQRIPGVTLIDSTANLDGRPGVAIGRVDSTGRIRQELIFDSAGGRFIGERQVAVKDGGVDDLNPSPVPDGETITSTSVSLSVADKPDFR